MGLENQICKKEQEIEGIKARLKKKKEELRILQERQAQEKAKEKAAFNARVVDEIEQRVGKFTEEELQIFLREMEKNPFLRKENEKQMEENVYGAHGEML